MNVRIKFLGGAGSVTGSKYLLEIDQFRLLVDCGLFQGEKELRLRNWDDFPVDVQEIDAVVITHAHIDHTGYLPRLFKQGFDGPVYCTAPTADLMGILLLDSAKLQLEEAEFARRKGYSKHANPEPLYKTEDVEGLLTRLQPHPFGTEVSISDKIKVSFQDSGHILGSSSVRIRLQGEQQEKTIVFSGDIGRYNQPIMQDPVPFQQADILLIESTYGNRDMLDHNPAEPLAEIINRAVERQGCVIIPAFAVGRTQTLLYHITRLIDERKIPSIPVYLDSPMAVNVTGLYKKHLQHHKLSAEELEDTNVAFEHKNVHYYNSHEASESLLELKKDAILISASGMCTGGRILNHLYHRLPRAQDTLLFVGYQAKGTRGRRILEGEPTIRIFGQDVPVKCQMEVLDGLSAHADKEELFQWMRGIKNTPKMTFIVHGEPSEADPFAQSIRETLGWNVSIPDYLESHVLFDHI